MRHYFAGHNVLWQTLPLLSFPPCMFVAVTSWLLLEAALVQMSGFEMTNMIQFFPSLQVQAQLLQFAAKNIGLNPALLTSPINPQQMTLLYQLQQLQMVSPTFPLLKKKENKTVYYTKTFLTFCDVLLSVSFLMY